MGENVPRTIDQQTRREFIELGVFVMGGLAIKSMNFIRDINEHAYPVGNDYGTDALHEGYGSHLIDQARVDELLIDDIDSDPLPLQKLTIENMENKNNIAEFMFEVDEPGPLHVEFEDLASNYGISQVVLRVAVDGGEPYAVPLIRSPLEREAQFVFQLGVHEAGEHRFEVSAISGRDGLPLVDYDEVNPRIVRGSADTVGSYIDMHQPAIYLRDYGDFYNNFPLRSLALVREGDNHVSPEYWKECVTEDRILRFFGTPVWQLLNGKNRPTDMDWDIVKKVSKLDGSLLAAAYARPYHNAEDLPEELMDVVPTPLRVLSLNNNMGAILDDSISRLPKVWPRPLKYGHKEGREQLYTTEESIALLSLQEHHRKGNIDLSNPTHLSLLEQLGFDFDFTAYQN